MNLHFIIAFVTMYLILRPAAQQEQLPGLTFLASGFDRSKLASKYKIFDLDYDGPIVTINGQQYASSNDIEVSIGSKRRETQCEGVYNTYRDFYNQHTTSWSIGVGITVSIVGIGAEYSRSLTKAHQAITTQNKSVGMAESWISQQSITLGPPFFLKLNNQFKTYVEQYLYRKAENPTTPEQQNYYNTFVKTYGTHQTADVIMGGKAKTYTYINGSYMKTTSSSKVTQQVSVGVTVSMFQLKGNIQWQEEKKKLDEDFSRNSETEVEFIPAPEVTPGKTTWDCWNDQVKAKPEVVNSTLVILSDLIFDYPKVEKHLKKTILFYLKNGAQPTSPQEVGVFADGNQLEETSLPIESANIESVEEKIEQKPVEVSNMNEQIPRTDN